MHPSSQLVSEAERQARRRMSPRQRALFFLTAWLIVLMPFLFWWNTWFGRPLSDKQLSQYLQDEKHPRHIQHALVQIGERISKNDSTVTRWYPEVIRLATHPVEEVRNTDAWVMGQDTSETRFRATLTSMLADSSAVVRGNAALSLVRFGDASGRPQILMLLQPATVVAQQSGTIIDASLPGSAVHQGGVILKMKKGERTIEVRSPINGRLRTLSAQPGQSVIAGTQVATIDPGTEQVWEALRALYLVGKFEDLPAILPFTRDLPDIPDRVRQQALETEKAIRARAN